MTNHRRNMPGLTEHELKQLEKARRKRHARRQSGFEPDEPDQLATVLVAPLLVHGDEDEDE